MNYRFDFPEITGRLQFESQDYSISHPNRRRAWTLVSSMENLRDAFDFVDNNRGMDTDDGKKFQHWLLYEGANTLESIFWLVKYHQYTAARGRCRYLYEVYLSMRGLNRDQVAAAEGWRKTREEAEDVEEEAELRPLEVQSDFLHSIRKEERREPEERRDGDAYEDFWMLMSDSGSHPTSMRGSFIDGRWSAEKETSMLNAALVFAFGIGAQYIQTFVDTETRWLLQNQLDPMFVEIRLVLPIGTLPTLFRPDLYFFDPRLGTPTTVSK